MATANPAMNEGVYLRAERATVATGMMTVQGTVIKTAILVAILLVTAGYTWSQASQGSWQLVTLLLIGGSIGGIVLAFATVFFPKIAPYTSPVYAACQGCTMGAISHYFDAKFPGLPIQALGLTVGVLSVMLFLFSTRIVRATEKFKIGVFAATGAIALVYLVGFIASFFGSSIPYIHESGWIGIGFSVVVVVIAALNLILDFDFIEQGVSRRAPKYMEWYGGFSLLVTLVWMYLEILRLLAKLRSSRD